MVENVFSLLRDLFITHFSQSICNIAGPFEIALFINVQTVTEIGTENGNGR